nr:G protein-coupled receptor [Proales similis]
MSESSLLLDVWWTFIIPGICLAGILFNSLCVWVFVSAKLDNPIYKLMLSMAVVDTAYLFFIGFQFLFNCRFLAHQVCYSFLVKLYELVFYNYLTASLAIFNITIEIVISVQRLFTITNRMYCTNLRCRYILLPLLFFSVVYYLPVPLSETIVVSQNQSSQFAISHNQFGESQAFRIVKICLQCIRGPGVFSILIVSNSIALFFFRRAMNRKAKLRLHADTSSSSVTPTSSKAASSHQTKANRNITRLTITMSFYYVLCNFPYMLCDILFQILRVRSMGFQIFLFVSLTCLYVYHGTPFFIHYFFNKRFKARVNKMFDRLRCRFGRI